MVLLGSDSAGVASGSDGDIVAVPDFWSLSRSWWVVLLFLSSDHHWMEGEEHIYR